MGEVCDDGNFDDGDGCDSNCWPTRCGNLVRSPGEECDDGNLVSGDGCDYNCTRSGCGNGIATAGEACDDADQVNGDGCDNNCPLTGCGNGIPTAGEVCDDGDHANGDGCDNNCTLPACGNGAVAPGEECDDGNAMNGDGCSALCQIELVPEAEPNHTLSQAAASPVQITGDATIQGAITPVADVDAYRVTVTTPTVVRFEALTSLYDYVASALDLRLFDAAGVPILADTAGSGIGSCGAIVVFLDAGTYFVSVEEHGSDAITADYLLQIDFQTSRGSEAEPLMSKGLNDFIATPDASLLGAGNLYVFGSHLLSSDNDVYAISVPPGARIRAEVVEGDRAAETCESGGIDSQLSLSDQIGTELASDNDGGRGACSLIDGTGTAPAHPAAHNATASFQTYYLGVRARTPIGPAAIFVYRLQITFH